MSLYKHILKPQDLKESKNEWVSEYYKDFIAEGGKNKKLQNGLETLRNDTRRNVTIRGKSVPEELEGKAFEDFIKNGLEIENTNAINRSYHQALVYSAVSPLMSHSNIGLESGLHIKGLEIKPELFVENGDVYLKTLVPAYRVNGEGASGVLAGPVESLYKLDKNEGFILQHIATNSDLIRDAYLGKPINKEKTLLPELHETLELAMQHHKNKMEDYKLEQSFESIKKIENLLKTQLGQPEYKDYKDYIDDALLTIALIKTNKMSLQTSQEKFKHLADHVKKHAPTQQFSLFDRMRGKKSVAEVLKEASKLLGQLDPELFKQTSSPQPEEKAPAPRLS